MTAPAVLDGADATSGNLAAIPAWLVMALYVTGTGGIPATAAQLARYPDALRIAQWPLLGTDEAVHADILDVETNAATAAECAPWARNAEAAWQAGTRPGQRHPAIYCGDGGQTAYVNAMIAAGVTSGVGLILVNYSLSRAGAIALIQANAALPAAANPFPVAGVQYGDQGGGGAYDTDVFLASWVNTRSGPALPPAPVPVTYLTAAQTEAIMAALPVLSPGITDSLLPYWYVHRLQAVLKDVYGYAVTVNGTYDAATAAGVKLVQARYGLTQDGICGPLTWVPVITGAA